jgi:diguanylate cyclase (GGDEF)-like protein
VAEVPETLKDGGKVLLLPAEARRYVPLVLTLLAGLFITLIVFFVFQAAERAQLSADFASVSSDRAQAIRTGLAEDYVALNLLASYLVASNELAQEDMRAFVLEFGRYAAPIPEQEADTHLLAFISRVPRAERKAFEVAARRDIDPTFGIKELGVGTELLPAGNRAEYLPVTTVEPRQGNEALFGLDLATIPAFNSAIGHAVATRRITASASNGLPMSVAGKPIVWHFLAVYRGLKGMGSAVPARGELMGLAASSFRIDQMVELSLKGLSPAGIDLELLDPKAPVGQQLLYYHKSRVPGFETSDAKNTGFSWSTTIDAGGRSWKLNAYATRDFLTRHPAWQSWTLLAGGLLLTAFGGVIMTGRLRRFARVELLVAERTGDLALEVAKHEKLERALAESRATLARQVDRLNLRNSEVLLRNEVGDMLQSCVSTEEACSLISLQAPRLLPGSSGTLYIHDPSQALYSTAAEWGAAPPMAAAFKAEDCWALRRGKVHAVTGSTPALPCRHAGAERDVGSLCVPLSATGKSIGLFHVTGCSEESQAYAVSVAEHIGLALSNLMLRSDLQQLSIHDPLTGLFNRRYMEETLEIEIRRSERTEHPIGVVMLDLDHFKTFNDRFGHAAGDELLRTLGSLLRKHLRAGDIACRYGGEEFVLILPEAFQDAAVQRAEDIRQRVKSLEVRYLDSSLGPVTVSLGVAIHPSHGRTRTDILAAADAALYKAKERGRDQVVAAESA